MCTAALIFLGVLIALASAAPQDADNFTLEVWNNCAATKEVGLYGMAADYTIVQYSTPVNITSKDFRFIEAPFHAVGMRLSGHAEWGTAGQWNAQALFEFGYSYYDGLEGTAYDISIMEGSDSNVGLGAWVIPNAMGSASCPSKVCFPWDCPLSQGWTNPNQKDDGSPADTVCYKGKTDFKIVFCP